MRKIILGVLTIAVIVTVTIIGVNRNKVNATMDLIWANVEAMAEDAESQGVKTIVSSTEVEETSYISGTYLVTCYTKITKIVDCKDQGNLICEKGKTYKESLGCDYSDMSGGGDITR